MGEDTTATHREQEEGLSPGLHLVLGPPNSGKIGHVCRWWEQGRLLSPVVVVPSRPDVTLLTLELTGRVGPFFGPAPVCTFEDLARRLTPGGGDDLGQPLGDVERRILLQGLLRVESLEAIGAVADAPGTVEAVGEVLRELAECGANPVTVRAATSRWAAAGGPVARDLHRLVAVYQDRLHAAARADRSDDLRAALRGCREWRSPVALYGFTSFTPAQRSLVRSLSSAVPVLLSLGIDPGRAYGGYLGAELGHWLPRARSVVSLDRQERAFASPALARLERSFLALGDVAPSAAPAQDGGGEHGVRFLVGSGRRAEVELAGREIVRLLRNGLSPDDIGVLVRHVGPWQRLVTQVFRTFGLPHRIDAESPLGRTGLGCALLQGLQGVATEQLPPLAAFLRSPYCSCAVEEVDRFEVRQRRSMALHGPEMVAALQREFPREIAGLREAVRGGSERKTLDPDGVSALAWAMLRAAARRNAFDSYEMQEDVAVHNAVTLCARQLARAEASGWVSAGTTGVDPVDLEHVLAQLAGTSVRTGRGDERGVVHVMPVSRARARRFSVVFVLGLVDGEFPAATGSPAVLSEGARRDANRFTGVPLFSEPVEGEEAALFALALSRPWQLLYLSTRDVEEDGTEAEPSAYWTEARRLAGDPDLYGRRDLRSVTHEPAEAPSVREYLRACAERHLEPPLAYLRDVVLSAPVWRCDPDRLCLDAVLQRLRGMDVFSATALEDYAQCPFAWFIKRLVRPGPMEEQLGPLQTGTVVHALLADVHRGLLAEGISPDDPAYLARAQTLLDRGLEGRVAAAAPGATTAESRLLGWDARRLCLEALRLDVARGGPLAPVALEYDLPREGVDLGGVRVSGRIDRIDGIPGGDSVFVVDYKSGTTAYGPRFAAEGALQVPLYILALRKAWPKSDPVGGAYLALGTGSVRGAVRSDAAGALDGWLTRGSRLDPGEFESELEAARAAAAEAILQMREGLIPAAPAALCPQWCDLRPICRTGNPVARWQT